jgi:hypothetical protein
MNGLRRKNVEGRTNAGIQISKNLKRAEFEFSYFLFLSFYLVNKKAPSIPGRGSNQKNQSHEK